MIEKKFRLQNFAMHSIPLYVQIVPQEKRERERKFSTITFVRRNGDCIEFPYRLLAGFPRTVPPSLFSPWTSRATCRYSFTLSPPCTRGTTILTFLSSCGTLSASGSGRRFEKARTIGIVSSFTRWKGQGGVPPSMHSSGTKDRGDIFCPREREGHPTITRIDTIFATTPGSLKRFLFISSSFLSAPSSSSY